MSRLHVSFLGVSQSHLIKELKRFTRRPRTSFYTALKRSSAGKPDFVNLFHSVYNFFVTFSPSAGAYKCKTKRWQRGSCSSIPLRTGGCQSMRACWKRLSSNHQIQRENNFRLYVGIKLEYFH